MHPFLFIRTIGYSIFKDALDTGLTRPGTLARAATGYYCRLDLAPVFRVRTRHQTRTSTSLSKNSDTSVSIYLGQVSVGGSLTLHVCVTRQMRRIGHSWKSYGVALWKSTVWPILDRTRNFISQKSHFACLRSQNKAFGLWVLSLISIRMWRSHMSTSQYPHCGHHCLCSRAAPFDSHVVAFGSMCGYPFQKSVCLRCAPHGMDRLVLRIYSVYRIHTSQHECS